MNSSSNNRDAESAIFSKEDKPNNTNNLSALRKVHPVALVLDNIRSAFNVGSIFRSAETAGVKFSDKQVNDLRVLQIECGHIITVVMPSIEDANEISNTYD